MACYLVHIEPPYKHAGHYVGYSDNVVERYQLHLAGKGARLLQVAVEAGCKLELARVWPDGDRSLERRLHNRHGSAKLCPICKVARTGIWHDDIVFERK